MEKEIKIDLIVTKHPDLIEYLKELEVVSDEVNVIAHATPAMIEGKNVCGVLPVSLANLCETFTEVPLSLPAELRGKELNVDQVRKFASELTTYKIIKL